MEDKNKKKRGTNATERQKKLLVEYVKSKPQLICGKQTQSYTKKDAQNDWESISRILNSNPGAIKDCTGWRKMWHDLRSRTKSKEAKNRMAFGGTGGGPLNDETLTNVEEDILDIIKKVSIEGHDVAESSVGFEFNVAEPVLISFDFEDMDVGESITSKATANGNTTVTHTRQGENSTSSSSGIATSNTSILETTEVVHTRSKEPSLAISVNVPSAKMQVTNTAKELVSSRKKMPKKLDSLINSAVAATSFEENLHKKLDVKTSYYERKCVKALQSIAKSLKKLVSNRPR